MTATGVGVVVSAEASNEDLQRMWDQLAEESGDVFGSMFTEGMMAPLQEMGEQMEFGLDLWVDDRGFARRTDMQMSLGDEVTVDMITRLYDIDEDIVVKLPRDYTDVPTGAISLLGP